MTVKTALRTQILLGPEKLDSRILAKLPTDQSLEVSLIEMSKLEAPELDLVDALLQANHMSLSLQGYRDKARNGNNPWTLEDSGLLKHQE